MSKMMLTYGPEGFNEIEEFLSKNCDESYAFQIYDTLSNDSIKIICDYDILVQVIMCVTNVEHDFPAWIEKKDSEHTCIIGMNLTRGRLNVPATYSVKLDGTTLKWRVAE